LPPSFIDEARRNGADGVFLTGCRGGDCLHRFGNTWTEGRLDESREPHLRHWVPRQRLDYFWASSGDLELLRSELKHFRHTLSEPLQDNPAPGTVKKRVDIGHG
jgi:coenzyme F420-reducing hydrogenase delta subunit